MLLSSRFIAANTEVCDFDHHVPSPYLRRAFDLDFAPEKAEITITGLGFYELSVNGTPITKGPLAPYISNPDDIVYYDKYDVASFLRPGKNVIGILLGNGMRNAFGGFVWDFDKAHFRGPVCTALAFEAEGEGKSLFFEADERFSTHPSPVTFNDLRMGCRYDARLEVPGWDTPDLDDADWTPAIPCPSPAGERRLCTAEPIRVHEVLHPISVTHYDSLPFAHKSCRQDAEPFAETVRENVYVYDFGVNTAGVTVLHIKGKPGQRITIRHGEYLQGGKFSMTTTMFVRDENQCKEKYFAYGQCDEYICRGTGEEEIFLPRFKYDGFRYAYVEGLLPEQATAEALEYRVMSSALTERGSFSSSSQTLNRLYEMVCRSDRANFYYFPTDCPHREKNGWTGDAAMSAEHMLLYLAGENSLRVWLDNIRRAQSDRGVIPGIVPTGGWGVEWGCGPVWDSVLFQLPYEIYRHTGDRGVITENLPNMLRYLTYCTSRRDERGLCAYGLGDWVDPYQGVTGKIAAPLELTDTVTLYDSAKKAEFLFREVGCKAEADFAAALAAEFRCAVRKHLIDTETLTAAGRCQTSQAYCIVKGIFDPEEIPGARQVLLRLVHEQGDLHACGMLGVRYIFHALIDAGYTDLAYRIIVSEKRTGYGAFIRLGQTAIPENFYYDDGREACSQNHHFLGDILSVMIQRFTGLCPNPTYRDIHSFAVAPHFVSDLTHAEATYHGVDGELFVRWEREGKDIRITVRVPEGMHGHLILPAPYRTEKGTHLTAGEHVFLACAD